MARRAAGLRKSPEYLRLHQGCRGWMAGLELPLLLQVFPIVLRGGLPERTTRAAELSAIPKPSCEPVWCGSTSATCMEARRQLCPPGVLWMAFASLISCLLAPCQAKVYSRCELFRVLQTLGLEGYQGYSLADCEYPSFLLALPPPITSFLFLTSPSPSLKGCGLRRFLSLSLICEQGLYEVAGREHPALMEYIAGRHQPPNQNHPFISSTAKVRIQRNRTV